MKRLAIALLAATAFAEHDKRLSVTWLVREDIFAGFLANDRARLENAERTLDELMKERPAESSDVVAWRGSILLTRAAWAHEAGKQAECRDYHKRAMAAFDEALAGKAGRGMVPITGGSMVALADRLPEPLRTESWERGYTMYKAMEREQRKDFDKMPLHLTGEVISGLAQTSQRTGRAEEAAKYLGEMVTRLAGSPYERAAKRWLERPETMAKSSVACQTCHEPNKLEARKAALGIK